MEKLVSVVMPVGDEISYLREAVDSILGQTYSNLELIVVDSSNSPEVVQAILAEYGNRYHHLVQEKCGIARALNYAIDNAKGDYIARMDADDISLPTRIRDQVEYMETHPDVEVLGTRCRMIDAAGKIIQENDRFGGFLDSNRIKAKLIFDNPIIHPSVMFRKKVFDNGWRYSTERHSEDLDLWTRMSKTVRIEVLDKKLLHYRLYANNTGALTEEKCMLSSTQSAKDYLANVFCVDVGKYLQVDFTKNHFLSWVREECILAYEDYILRQIILIKDIIRQNSVLHIVASSALIEELNCRWILLMEQTVIFDNDFRTLLSLAKNSYKNGTMFLLDIQKHYGLPKDEFASTYKFLEITVKRNQTLRKQLFLQKHKILLYGMGDIGQRLIKRMEKMISKGMLLWELCGAVDRNCISFKFNDKLYNTVPKERLLELSYDYVIISSEKFHDEIFDELIKKGVPNNKILDNTIF